MKRISYLILLFILCTSTTCFREDENSHTSIRFSNRADYAIYVSYKDLYNRNDTTPVYKFSSYLEIVKINPNEINANSLVAFSWEAVFTDERIDPIDTLMIFVFEAEKVEADASPQEALIARYEVSLEDLQRNHWLLSYPPNGNMAAIRMWPPYSSYLQ